MCLGSECPGFFLPLECPGYHVEFRSIQTVINKTKIVCIKYNYSTLNNKNSYQDTTKVSNNNFKDKILKILYITFKIMLTLIILFYIQNLIIPLLKSEINIYLLNFVSDFQNSSFYKIIINIIESKSFNLLLHILSFFGLYNIISFTSIIIYALYGGSMKQKI